MTTDLVPYGLTLPLWFCPVKNQDYQSVYNAYLKYGPPGNGSLSSPNQFIGLANNPINYQNKFLTIYYSVYIPRQYNAVLWWPMDRQAHLVQYGGWIVMGQEQANPALPGWPTPWPMGTSSKWEGKNPILTDRCYGSSQSPASINASGYMQESGHPYGNSVANCNLLYADGHVVVHNFNAFQWTFQAATGTYNFY
jgi:prepilin-type processing-associated H-X9-DG protein